MLAVVVVLVELLFVVALLGVLIVLPAVLVSAPLRRRRRKVRAARRRAFANQARRFDAVDRAAQMDVDEQQIRLPCLHGRDRPSGIDHLGHHGMTERAQGIRQVQRDDSLVFHDYDAGWAHGLGASDEGCACSSQIRKVLRPAALAWYMATSAFLIRSSMVSRSSMNTTMPMLGVLL